MVQSRTSDRMCGYCMDDIMSHDGNGHPTSNPEYTTKEIQFVQYLYDLSEQLRSLKEKECSSLIVYGVAFGEQYTHWLTRQQGDTKGVPYQRNAEQVQELLRLHGPCFMTFVLAEHLTDSVTQVNNNNNSSTTENQYYYSNDGLQLLVPIHRKDLPYANMRRNTKIFKMMGPSYLFGN
jgi:hypothetical protein